MESFQIPGWGGGWGSLSKWECNRAFPVKNKGNESYKEPKEAISTRNISICRNGGRPCSLGLVKHDAWSYQLYALALVRFVSEWWMKKIRNVTNWCCKYKLQDDKSFTRHEKCISRNRKNTNREKVENFF